MENNKPQFDRKLHGSLFDRGGADSYYRRPRTPHWWSLSNGNTETITDLTAEEIAEYKAGYKENEEAGAFYDVFQEYDGD